MDILNCLKSCFLCGNDSVAECMGMPQPTREYKIEVAGRRTPPPSESDREAYTLSEDFTRLTIYETDKIVQILRGVIEDPIRSKQIRHVHFEQCHINSEMIEMLKDFPQAVSHSVKNCPATPGVIIMQTVPEEYR